MKERRIKVTRSSGNVFADIGLANPEEHLLKAQVAVIIGELINRLGLTQTAAAIRLGVAQADISRILSGQLNGYSLARLFEVVRTLGNDIEIKVKPAKEHQAGRYRMIA